MENTSSLSKVFGTIYFLTQSRNRVRILQLVMRRGECSRRECEEHLDVSRTTVQRNLDAMDERGLVRETVDGYAVTTYGERLLTEFVGFAETVQSIDRLRPFLQRVSPREFDVEIGELDDARITVASANDPYAPIERQVELLREAGEFRLCTDILGRTLFEQIRARAVDHGCPGELVLTSDALETFESDPAFGDLYAELTDTEGVHIYEHPGELVYALGIVDDLIQISVEDDRCHVHALVEAESPAVRDWAERRYAAHKQRASLVA